MISAFQLKRLLSSIWLRPAVFAFTSILVVLATPVLSRLVPEGWIGWVDQGAVEQTLSILASSMLAVAIFSLATLFSAFEAAARAATPRARALMTEDRTAQYAVSTFIGAFLFSILGLIGLNTNLYDEVGVHVLFALTLLVIGVVVFTLVRWIERLGSFGGIPEAIQAIETATLRAIERDRRDPACGGALRREPPDGSEAVPAARVGYVQAVDMALLGRLCAEHDCAIHVSARAGTLVGPGEPVAWTTSADPDVRACILEAVTMGPERTFAEDPRFGILCLAEIAMRALSPAVNDPGTAIATLRALLNTLERWGQVEAEPDLDRPTREGLSRVPLDPADFIEDGFRAIARDGAGHVEVAIRLHKTLAMLRDADPDSYAEACRAMSEAAAGYADQAMTLDQDRARIATLRDTLELR